MENAELNMVEKDGRFSNVLETIDSFLKNLDTFKINDILYIIEGEEVETIVSSLHSCKIPRKYGSYQDVLREKISSLLKLERFDTVIFTDDAVYIKKFLQIESKENQERRACGLAPELLEEYKDKYFPNNSHEDKIFDMLTHVCEDILSFKRVTVPEFKKAFISVFINMFEIVIIENSDLEDEKIIKGLALYLLREMFDNIMLYIAEDILFNFSNQDKRAIEFLSFFSINAKIDANGQKHKANPLLDDNKHAWNMTTIRSTMLQHKKAKQAVYDKKNALISMKKRLNEYVLEERELNKLKNEEESKFLEIEENITAIHNNLDKLQDSTADKVTYQDGDEEKIFQRKPLIAKLFKKEDDLLSQKNIVKKNNKDLDIKLNNKQKDIDIWQKKYKEEKDMLISIEKKGHPTDILYARIKKALAKALTKR